MTISDIADTLGSMILMKTDKDLNVIWKKTYPRMAQEIRVNTISEDSKTKDLYLLGGQWTHGSNTLPDVKNKVHFIKVDSSGNILAEHTPGSGGESNGNNMVKTGDGNFLVSGKTWGWGQNSLGSVFSMKVDTAGNELWHQLYAANAYACWIENNLRVDDNTFINVGGVVQTHSVTPTSLYGHFGGYVNRIDSRPLKTL